MILQKDSFRTVDRISTFKSQGFCASDIASVKVRLALHLENFTTLLKVNKRYTSSISIMSTCKQYLLTRRLIFDHGRRVHWDDRALVTW